MSIHSFAELSTALENNPTLVHELQTEPKKFVRNLALLSEIPDTFIYRTVVLSLGIALLLVIIGGFVVVSLKVGEIPAAMVSIGSAALGALAGLLAPSPVKRG